jgi:hypothetical protein
VLQEATGFVRCSFCDSSLVLDLTGVRLHYRYRPRIQPSELLPVLRRWCDAQSLPSPSTSSAARLVYRPFWRYAARGRPRMVPAWGTLESRWADVPVPEGEQALYDPSALGDAEVTEPDVAEAAARQRAFGDGTARTAGDLVHAPFYEIEMRVGSRPIPVSLEACSGRVYAERLPASASSAGFNPAGGKGLAFLGFLAMAGEAILIRPPWLAALAIGLTAVALYVCLVAPAQAGGRAER